MARILFKMSNSVLRSYCILFRWFPRTGALDLFPSGWWRLGDLFCCTTFRLDGPLAWKWLNFVTFRLEHRRALLARVIISAHPSAVNASTSDLNTIAPLCVCAFSH